MKLNHSVFLTIAVGAVLSACSAAPERIEALEAARTIVPQVESSPRAGVAATSVSDARKALDEANRLADSGAELADIEYEAQNAVTNARIAQEKMLTVEAREQIGEGKQQRQTVLLDARERDVKASEQDAAASERRADSLEAQLAGLQMQKTERGLVLTLGDVLFDSGGSTLRSGAYGTIDRLAGALRDNAGRSVVIEGHTDNVGSDAMNQSLSERRAQSVEMALLQRGVPSGQVRSLGNGERIPVASNDHEAGRQQNRRVELIFAESQMRTGALE